VRAKSVSLGAVSLARCGRTLKEMLCSQSAPDVEMTLRGDIGATDQKLLGVFAQRMAAFSGYQGALEAAGLVSAGRDLSAARQQQPCTDANAATNSLTHRRTRAQPR
jgi:hypothetical protein